LQSFLAKSYALSNSLGPQISSNSMITPLMLLYVPEHNDRRVHKQQLLGKHMSSEVKGYKIRKLFDCFRC